MSNLVTTKISADTWTNLDGSENYKCRAWVNFNGTGTVRIRGSGNVSSITDRGTADYNINFLTPMPDANYATNFSFSNEVSSSQHTLGFFGNLYTENAVNIQFYNITSSTSRVDKEYVSVQVIR